MRVAILGCGYVGLELCRQLTDGGHGVVGIRRSSNGIEAVEAAGGDGVRADVTDPASLAGVPDVDAIVFTASSGGRSAAPAREVYVEGLQTCLTHFGRRGNPPERMIYTSSTGVYGDHDGGWVDEETPLDPTTAKTRVLARAEQVALDASATHGIDGTVARYAGLYGSERYRLERYIDGPVTEGYLNMVHRDDAAGVVHFLLIEDLFHDETVLVVDDEPVSKWTFADWLADECGAERPEKRTKAARLGDGEISDAVCRRLETSKRCSNEKVRENGYEFAYPTFREGYQEAIEEVLDESH